MSKKILCSRNVNFCPDVFGHVRNQLHKKAKVCFKIYGMRDWEANNYNTHIAHYLKK